MANPEHVKILRKRVDVWNKWRLENPRVYPDLIGEDLFNSDLMYFNFEDADLSRTNLGNCYLQGANFDGANLSSADIHFADLSGARLRGTNLYKANLSGADLGNTIIFYANLSEVILKDTSLVFSTIRESSFIKTNFADCVFGATLIGDCDLSKAIDLEDIRHISPSSIGFDTLFRSAGKIPEVFLRGCGMPEGFITYSKPLTTNPIDFYSCFISFTEKDDAFSERLYNDMQAKGVRCWRWKEDAPWGKTLRTSIDEAVHYYDKLVVICSKDSLKAPAVLEEIERALDKEDSQKRNGEEGEVLFPIRIDNFVFEGWESELKVRLTKKNIGDFRDWNSDAETYRKSVGRLVRDLNRPRKQ